jgi:hypothetical protein
VSRDVISQRWKSRMKWISQWKLHKSIRWKIQFYTLEQVIRPYEVMMSYCDDLAQTGKQIWKTMAHISLMTLTMGPGRLLYSNLAPVLQYCSGLSSVFLAKILGVDTPPFLWTTQFYFPLSSLLLHILVKCSIFILSQWRWWVVYVT